MRPTPDTVQEEILPSTKEAPRSAGIIERLRKSTVMPIAASLSMLVASAGADDKKGSPQDPKATIELRQQEFAKHPNAELIRLLDSGEYASRMAAFSILRTKAIEEKRATKNVSWQAELSVEGKSAEQRRLINSILNDLEDIEKASWWEGTLITIDAQEKQRMSTLGGTLDAFRKFGDCKVTLDNSLPAHMLAEPVTNIPDSGTFWEVLRSLRVQKNKQIVPFLTNGQLMVTVEDAKIPTTCSGALYGSLKKYNDDYVELNLLPEPKLFGYSQEVLSAKSGRTDLPLVDSQPLYGKCRIAKPVGLGATGQMSISTLSYASRMKKFHLEGPDGKILRHDGVECDWQGIPQEPANGKMYARIRLLGETDGFDGVQCEMFTAEGLRVNDQMQCFQKFWPGQKTWKVLDEAAKPASANLYLPGRTVSKTQRTLHFTSVPQSQPKPHSAYQQTQ